MKRPLIVGVVILAIAAPAFAQRDGGGQPNIRGVVKAVDAKAGTITLASGGGRETAPDEKTYSLAKNVEVCINTAGFAGFRGGAFFKEAKLADVTTGTTVGLVLTADQKLVDAIIAEEAVVRGILKSVDAQKKTLSVGMIVSGGREQPAGENVATYTVNADTEIAIDDGRGRRFSIQEGKLEDLAQGATVTLRLTLDKKNVTSVLAEGATVFGVLKEIDPAKRSMTVTTRSGRGDDAGEERVLSVSRDALVLVDDGKGRRLSVKEGKLADVPVGAIVMARLSADQGFVMMLKAEGPTVSGILKSLDTDKHAITIAIAKSREEVEEKTYLLSKDGRINIDGKDATFADLKVGENGPLIQLRLALDQKTAQSVISRQPERR